MDLITIVTTVLMKAVDVMRESLFLATLLKRRPLESVHVVLGFRSAVKAD